jgi:hypothetical protein
MKTSKTYIVTWDELLYNGLDVDKQLSSANLDYLVFDVSSLPIERPNWVVAEKVRYYGHFYNSLVDFSKTNHDIFIFNAGDAITENHVECVRRIEQLMTTDENTWIASPRMAGDGSDGLNTLIHMSKKYRNLGLSLYINGIYVALHRDLALFILQYYEWLLKNKHMDFQEMTTGHCLDVVYASWALYNNKKIYRDWTFWLTTLPGTSYNTAKTAKECTNIKNRFVEFVSELGYNGETIKRIYDAIVDKEANYRGVEYPLLKAYPNLIHKNDLDY